MYVEIEKEIMKGFIHLMINGREREREREREK